MRNMQSRKEYNKSTQKVFDFLVITGILTLLIYLLSMHFYLYFGIAEAIKVLLENDSKLLLAYFFMCFATAFFATLFYFTYIFQDNDNDDEHKRGSRLIK